MENNQAAADDDQVPNVGWFRGQELALQLGLATLATFLCLALAIIRMVRPFLVLFPLAAAIAIILAKLAELIYHGVCLYPFLMVKIVIFVVLWYYCLMFLMSLFIIDDVSYRIMFG